MITSSTLSAGKNKCQETTKQEFEKSSLGTPSVITMITIEGASLFTESRSGRYPANNSRSFWPVGVVPTFKKSRNIRGACTVVNSPCGETESKMFSMR